VTGTSVHTLTAGRPDGPLVVLVHGLEDTWAGWRPLAAQLDPGWRVVALDLPWRAGNDYQWRYRTLGQWLGEGLDLLDSEPDAMIAHSFGANAALQLACAYGRRPGRALGLVCPMYRELRHAVTWRTFDRARAIFVENIRESLLARMGNRVGLMDASVLANMVDLVVDRVGPFGFLTMFEQLVASAHLRLETVDVPTLVLAGGADHTMSPATVTALATGIPGARLRIVDEYDHFCHVRHAAGVAAQVTDLVGTVRDISSTDTIWTAGETDDRDVA
jgi:pimeloyl-ACP methyl ester carboxylesterase